MTERPILFSGPMVQAILEGRKRVTRRVIRGQILGPDGQWVLPDPLPRCPYGDVGDRLWVREAWLHECPHCDDPRCGNADHIWYRASERDPGMFPQWRPAMFMPRWASRRSLEIVERRVERVQEVTRNDALDEGVDPVVPGQLTAASLHPTVYSFHLLWDSLNATRGYGWVTNPGVWVIRFRVLEGPA